MTSVSLISSTSSTLVAAAAAASSEAALPITVITYPSPASLSVFFPFHDLVTLNKPQKDKFTFKELIHDGVEGLNTLTLFTEGCQVDGESDCTRACKDDALLFSSLETFYNCIALSSIAYWTQDTGRYYISDEAERNASTVMKSGSLRSFDGKPVLSSFVACAQDACGSDGLDKPCDDSIKQLGSQSNATAVFEAMDLFCPDIAAEINPDIFGPGVSEHSFF